MTALVPLKKEFQFATCAECSPTRAHVNKDGNTELIKIFLSQVALQVSLLCNVEHKLMLTEEQRTKTRRSSCLLQSRGAKDNMVTTARPPEWAQTWKWAGSLSQTQRIHSKHTWDKHTQSNRDELTRKWRHKCQMSARTQTAPLNTCATGTHQGDEVKLSGWCTTFTVMHQNLSLTDKILSWQQQSKHQWKFAPKF